MKRLVKWAGTIILGLLLCGVALTLLLPSVFSGRLAIVRSSSMEPAMPAGALALTFPIAPDEVKVGDIIAFEAPLESDVTVSHRVIELRANGELYFVTKGDACEDPDPFLIPAVNLQGKVILNIPHLGYALNSVIHYVRTRVGFIFLVCIPTAILVSTAIKDINRSRNARVRRLNRRLKAQRRWGRQPVHGLA